MSLIIVGIEKNKSWKWEGRSGVASYLYCYDDNIRDDKPNENGHYFRGSRIERVKLPTSIDADSFDVGQKINVYYNRFGSCEAVTPA